MHDPRTFRLLPRVVCGISLSLAWVLGTAWSAGGPATHRSPAEPLAPEEIMRRVDLRDTGSDVEWDMTITLRNRNAEERVRTCKLFRKEFLLNGKRQTRQVVVFLAPQNIRNVGMLSFDYKNEALDDDMWLYLPALKKVRRIPAANRGDNFVGTDFTFEDVKQGFAVDDYSYRLLGEDVWEDDGRYPVYRIEATPRTDQLRKALGFHRSVVLVRKDIYVAVEQTFYDQRNEPVRVNRARDFQEIQGIWTAMRLESHNLAQNHETVLQISRCVYNQSLGDDLFHERTLVSERIR